jgi:maleylacetoacetate isomerase
LPVLEVNEEDGTPAYISQSVAIAEYLDERWPERPLFPGNRQTRAHVRMLTEVVNSGIQPLHNAVVLQRLRDEVHTDDVAWGAFWIRKGLAALERLAKPRAGRFLVGDMFSFADCALVAQFVPSRRLGVDLSEFPLLLRVESAVLAIPELAAARPEAQPDAPH